MSLSGVSTSDAPVTNAVAWIYDTLSSIDSSPAVADGILYVGALDGTLFALDASTGDFLWSYSTGSSIHSSPAVDGGKVFFLSIDGVMHAVDAGSGTVSWTTTISTSPAWDWSSPAVSGGNVFIASSNGIVYSLAAADGSVNWQTVIGATANSMIAVANGKVYSGTHNFDNTAPTLVALNEADGSVAWIYDYYLSHGGVTGMINCNGVSVADGDSDGNLEVYFGVYNWGGVGPQAICLDEATGTEEWAVSIGGDSTSTPAIHNGVVFIGSDDSQLYALDATSSGNVLWTSATGGAIYASPAVADGMVFVGSLDHTFYAFDEVTGALVWSYYTGASRLQSSPAVADGMVFVGNENGNVYAFSALTVDKQLVDAWEDVPGDGILDLYEKWFFEMEITITNNTDATLADIIVQDNFGGDLEVVSVGGVAVSGPEGKKDDEQIATAVGDVTILWTGKTYKAHLSWDITSLGAGESITLGVVVATDENPGQGKKESGKNEYTSLGIHILNSGPTAMCMMGDEEVAVTDSSAISVTVGEAPLPPA
jgi:outer membrane protein assembly factor BamB